MLRVEEADGWLYLYRRLHNGVPLYIDCCEVGEAIEIKDRALTLAEDKEWEDYVAGQQAIDDLQDAGLI